MEAYRVVHELHGLDDSNEHDVYGNYDVDWENARFGHLTISSVDTNGYCLLPEGFHIEMINFSGSNLKTLELENVFFNDDTCKAFVEQVGFLENLSEFRITDGFSIPDVDLFANILTSASSLKTLSFMKSSSFNRHHCDMIGKLITQSHFIENLTISNCKLSPSAIECLSQSIRSNRSIKEITLTLCGINDDDCVILGESFHDESNVQRLDLGKNRITAAGALHILNYLNRQPSTFSLNLSVNEIGLDQMAAICRVLRTHPYLSCIDLRGCMSRGGSDLQSQQVQIAYKAFMKTLAEAVINNVNLWEVHYSSNQSFYSEHEETINGYAVLNRSGRFLFKHVLHELSPSIFCYLFSKWPVPPQDHILKNPNKVCPDYGGFRDNRKIIGEWTARQRNLATTIFGCLRELVPFLTHHRTKIFT